jgi:hypothetical protein
MAFYAFTCLNEFRSLASTTHLSSADRYHARMHACKLPRPRYERWNQLWKSMIMHDRQNRSSCRPNHVIATPWCTPASLAEQCSGGLYIILQPMNLVLWAILYHTVCRFRTLVSLHSWCVFLLPLSELVACNRSATDRFTVKNMCFAAADHVDTLGLLVGGCDGVLQRHLGSWPAISTAEVGMSRPVLWA